MTIAVLAADLGGTNTRVAVTGPGSQILDTRSSATPSQEGPTAIIANLAERAIELMDAHPDLQVAGFGVATAGVVDRGAGVIVSATDTLAGWAGTRLAEELRLRLSDRLRADAVIDVQNDVDAHAWGEFRYGAAQGCESALVVAVGTGVGAGLILNSRPHHGARHVAGEMAHIPTPGAEGFRCPCGTDGHLEAIGSGLGMHRLFLSRGGDPAVRDARQIVDAAASGDAIAQQAVRESAAAVGRAIAGVVSVVDPDTIVITGGVADIGDLWWDALREAYRSTSIDALRDVPLVAGTAGGHAALRGAADPVWTTTAGAQR